ncbi:hypothetical protein N431DRAFT_86910 [Stipitochalara longipes BDJ]|nr:hypothetical protein N431DRAFT_86910 [Stipitochalara longipes BDJ]
MGHSVYTAAASSIPPADWPEPSQPAGVFRNFATCDKAHFTRKVGSVSRTTGGWPPPSASRPVTTILTSRSGPSLCASSLTARVEREIQLLKPHEHQPCSLQARPFGFTRRRGLGGTVRNRRCPGPPSIQPLGLFISTLDPCLPSAPPPELG